MNEEYVGVILTATGLALVVAGLAILSNSGDRTATLVFCAATIGLGALVCGCLFLYRTVGRRTRK